MTLEEAIAKQFAVTLMTPMPDQWGNIQQSPVDLALRRWADEHKNEITTAVVKAVTLEKIADAVAERVLGNLKSGYRDDSEKLGRLVREKLASMLAERELARLDEKAQ